MNYHRLKPVVSGPPKLNSFDEAIGPSIYRLEAIVVDYITENMSMLTEVAKNIFLVAAENNGRFPYCHGVLVTGRLTALVETGCGAGILAAVEEKFRPDRIILSHGHPDHCSGSWLFPPERIWAPRERREETGDVRRMAERFVREEIREYWIASMREEPGLRDFKAQNHFSGGHRFDFGGITMEAVHAPGHTDDHYCFYFPAQKIMFTTDIDLTPFGPWYGNPESDIDRFVRSIRTVRGYEMATVISPHLGVIRDGIRERFDAFLGVIREREEKILRFLRSPRNMSDFVEAALIYRKYSYREPIMRYLEAQMVGKHLDRLIIRGRVGRKGDRYYRI